MPDGALARAASDAALDVAGLTHRFGRHTVLHDVAFRLDPGQFTVLLGRNGAGKTTLFALITRLYHAQTGQIAVFGQPFRTNPAAALSRMGVVFQQSTLDLDLTVRQNLAYHAALHGMPASRATPRIHDELDRIGLLDRADIRVRLLSGGQRRRVELARALIHDPALLLLDEPTVGLDIESRAFLLQHVRSLCRERRLAALWATHLIDEATDDSAVIVLHQGRIRAHGSVPRVIADAGAATLGQAFEHLTQTPPP